MNNILGSRIKNLRERMDLSQKNLSNKLNITNVQLSRYETGHRKPDPEMIVRIADFFHVTTDYLLGLESTIRDPKTPYLTGRERNLLEKIKSRPDFEKLLYEINEAPSHKVDMLIRIWEVIRNHRES